MGYGIWEWGAKDKKTEAKNWGLGTAAEDGGPKTEDRRRRTEGGFRIWDFGVGAKDRRQRTEAAT